jgi:hypothetical protein
MNNFSGICDGGARILGLCNLKFRRVDCVVTEGRGGGLITEATTWRLWFVFRLIHVRFKVEKLERKQLFSEHFGFPCH